MRPSSSSLICCLRVRLVPPLGQCRRAQHGAALRRQRTFRSAGSEMAASSTPCWPAGPPRGDGRRRGSRRCSTPRPPWPGPWPTPATVPDGAAVAEQCRVERFDVDALGAGAALGGQPVIPLVAALRAVVGADHAAVRARRRHEPGHPRRRGHAGGRPAPSRLVGDGLRTPPTRAPTLGEPPTGRRPMIGRTLLPAGRPDDVRPGGRHVGDSASTPPALASPSCARAGWRHSSAGRRGRLRPTASAAPRSSSASPPGSALAVPVARGTPSASRIVDLAGALGAVAAAAGKVAAGHRAPGPERGRRGGRGGRGQRRLVVDGRTSTTRSPPCRPGRRPCRRPGLVATLLTAAGGHELERAAGAWHAEWPALDQLLRVTGSAVDWLADSLSRLGVDPERMASNLARSHQEHGAGDA